MSKHTPGPWRLIPDARDAADMLVCGPSEHPAHIATVAVGGAIDAPEDRANAQLIAAAPDLLLALRSARFAMDVQRTLEYRDDPKRAAHWDKIIAAADAAIAKAEAA